MPSRLKSAWMTEPPAVSTATPVGVSGKCRRPSPGRRNTCTDEIEKGKVHDAVAVEIGPPEIRKRPERERSLAVKRAIALTKKDGDRPVAVVARGQIETAVAVEVARPRSSSGRLPAAGVLGCERAVSVAE